MSEVVRLGEVIPGVMEELLKRKTEAEKRIKEEAEKIKGDNEDGGQS